MDKFTRRTKPVRIIGHPDNQRPDKWSSTVSICHFDNRTSFFRSSGPHPSCYPCCHVVCNSGDRAGKWHHIRQTNRVGAKHLAQINGRAFPVPCTRNVW